MLDYPGACLRGKGCEPTFYPTGNISRSRMKEAHHILTRRQTIIREDLGFCGRALLGSITEEDF